MTTSVQSVYSVTATNAATTALSSNMAAMPVPLDVMQSFSSFVSSDGMTTAGSIVSRTIIYGLDGAGATATANINVDGTVVSLSWTSSGNDYVTPPIVTFTPPATGNKPQRFAQYVARMRANNVVVTAGGTGYS